MRAFQIAADSNRAALHFAGTIRPVFNWEDGAMSKDQATTSDGVLLWDVDVLTEVAGFGGNRTAETIPVRLPAKAEPQLQRFAPLQFERLELAVYLSKGDIRVNLSAAGLVGAAAPRGSESKAAA